MDLSNDEVALVARALSIHRAAMRRKLDRIRSDGTEYVNAFDEVRATSALVEKFNAEDMRRTGAA